MTKPQIPIKVQSLTPMTNAVTKFKNPGRRYGVPPLCPGVVWERD
jgi:hypothetical protein